MIGPGPLFRLNKKADREKEYKWLSDMGVAGIKVDFFSGDSVSTMNYYIDLLEDAVKYKLMLNFHGVLSMQVVKDHILPIFVPVFEPKRQTIPLLLRPFSAQ